MGAVSVTRFHRPPAARFLLLLVTGGLVALVAVLADRGSSPSAKPPSVVPAATGAHGSRRPCTPALLALRAGGKLRRSAPCAAAVDPSGVPAPTRDLPGWRLVFVDDFRSRIGIGRFGRGRKWNPYPHPWRDTSKNGTYWPQRGLSTHDGVLDIWLHTERVDGEDTHIVNAPQPVIPGVERGQLYGRYAIRFKADPVPGYKTAWLLWPDSGERHEGEIDFPEGNLTGTISAFVHPVDARGPSDKSSFSTGTSYRAWHTAVIEWSPGRVAFIFDGRKIGAVTSRVPDRPMHWVIQTETQLSGGPPPDDASGHVYIDWAAAYART
jgi:beta-glucanase (GH16 family)